MIADAPSTSEFGQSGHITPPAGRGSVNRWVVLCCGVLLLSTLVIPWKLGVSTSRTYFEIWGFRGSALAFNAKVFKVHYVAAKCQMPWDAMRLYSLNERVVTIGFWIIAGLVVLSGLVLRKLSLAIACLALAAAPLALQAASIRLGPPSRQGLWSDAARLFEYYGLGLSVAAALALCAICRRVGKRKWTLVLCAISGLLLAGVAGLQFNSTGSLLLFTDAPTSDPSGLGRGQTVEYQLMVEAIPAAMRAHVWLTIGSELLLGIAGVLLLLHAALGGEGRMSTVAQVAIYSSIIAGLMLLVAPSWILNAHIHPTAPRNLVWPLAYWGHLLLLAEGAAGLACVLIARREHKIGFPVGTNGSAAVPSSRP